MMKILLLIIALFSSIIVKSQNESLNDILSAYSLRLEKIHDLGKPKLKKDTYDKIIGKTFKVKGKIKSFEDFKIEISTDYSRVWNDKEKVRVDTYFSIIPTFTSFGIETPLKDVLDWYAYLDLYTQKISYRYTKHETTFQYEVWELEFDPKYRKNLEEKYPNGTIGIYQSAWPYDRPIRSTIVNAAIVESYDLTLKLITTNNDFFYNAAIGDDVMFEITVIETEIYETSKNVTAILKTYSIL